MLTAELIAGGVRTGSAPRLRLGCSHDSVATAGRRGARLCGLGRTTLGLGWQDIRDSGMLERVRMGRIVEAKERL